MEIIVVLNSKTTHVHVNMACNLDQKKTKGLTKSMGRAHYLTKVNVFLIAQKD